MTINKDLKDISKRIIDLMDNKKLSMGKLSELTKIPKTTIFRYVNDPGTIPTDRLSVISKALNTTPAYLMGWEDDKKDIYGNHNNNIEYLSNDPELLEFYLEMHKSENLKILFDTARELKPEELEKVLRYMKLVIDEEL